MHDITENESNEFLQIFNSGDIAIIPVGFRCYTHQNLYKTLGIRQPSLPFNSGFFPPDSVASIFLDPNINLIYNDNSMTHNVCTKTENNRDIERGLGIKFLRTTYNDIDKALETTDKIHIYVDSTFGYYTVDNKHNFLLAHYNWSKLASIEKSHGVTDPKENLTLINLMMKKRIERMFRLCDEAKHIFFVFQETQSYNYMQIDNKFYNLRNFDRLDNILKARYGDKFSIIDLDKISSAKDLLNLYYKNT